MRATSVPSGAEHATGAMVEAYGGAARELAAWAWPDERSGGADARPASGRGGDVVPAHAGESGGADGGGPGGASAAGWSPAEQAVAAPSVARRVEPDRPAGGSAAEAYLARVAALVDRQRSDAVPGLPAASERAPSPTAAAVPGRPPAPGPTAAPGRGGAEQAPAPAANAATPVVRIDQISIVTPAAPAPAPDPMASIAGLRRPVERRAGVRR
ncbi:hypothetical protein [Yinghuangia seranimata]|uniref:hypothetical protein n=1 Tax=Yinghuangia seranimata TaxID=408067 RepID=UPI00248CF308|nr:hypothetical protein [Yinghuangia seranimata]MDI2131694.1 hypothetical protein [Yinghuangia seranimata]